MPVNGCPPRPSDAPPPAVVYDGAFSLREVGRFLEGPGRAFHEPYLLPAAAAARARSA